MIYSRVPWPVNVLPETLQRHILRFEATIEDSVRAFSASLATGDRVLDAGAGELQYKPLFPHLRYVSVDLGIGDAEWSYRRLDTIANLQFLPFASNTFAGCINIVTLEHVQEPGAVLCELARVLCRGGRLLLITPLEWEEHQQPHDYFRYTRFGLRYLLDKAGLEVVELRPCGGFFQLLARRLLVAPRFFPVLLAPVIFALVALPGLLLPLLDGLDRKQDFTLGHICIARKL
ncbi:MAG: methyltransferase domain-containing protein [Bryobacteraceae bacterium]|nr:methyltransferase domain-containing protein [Bryobacteraceae bacterium]